MTLLDSPGGGGFQNKVATILPGSITTADIADGAVTSIKLANDLQSDNYVAGVSGWKLTRNTGDLEANDITARGSLKTGITGRRIEIDNNGFAVEFYSGNANETAPGVIDIDANGNVRLVAANWSTETQVTSVRLLRTGTIELFPGDTGLVQFGTGLAGERAIMGFTTGQAQMPFTGAGASTPAYAFFGDDDTGMYQAGGNTLGFATGGAERFVLGATGLLGPATGSAAVRSAAGTEAAPAFMFVGDLDTGMYRVGANIIGFATGGTAAMTLESAGMARFVDGTVANPGISFINDSDTGWHRFGGNNMWGIAGGVAQVAVLNGGANSSFYIDRRLTDVGNVETLRLDRTTTAGLEPVGWFSSWEFEQETGRRAKRNITPLTRSPLWRREWFTQLRPITFIRTSTKGREFGFRIEDFQAVHDNLKYLTTKGNEWGGSLDEFGLLAVTIDYVQYLEERVKRLETTI